MVMYARIYQRVWDTVHMGRTTSRPPWNHVFVFFKGKQHIPLARFVKCFLCFLASIYLLWNVVNTFQSTTFYYLSADTLWFSILFWLPKCLVQEFPSPANFNGTPMDFRNTDTWTSIGVPLTMICTSQVIVPCFFSMVICDHSRLDLGE